MDLDFSDDQRMLKESVDRLITDRYGFEQRTAIISTTEGWSRDVWASFAEMGLTMLPFSEEQGGLGLGGVETMIVGEAFGRGLVVEPYLASIVLAGTALTHGGTAGQIDRWLPDLMGGEKIAALADNASISATRQDGAWRLDGGAQVVLGGDVADILMLPADGAVFVVDAGAAGLSRRGYRLHGGGSASDVTLDGVIVTDDARLAGEGALIRAVEAGLGYLAAEAYGAMQAALDITVEYLKTREQFGKPIGTNQALQHKAAEMLVEVEQARSAAIYAALLDSETDAGERARGFAAVKAVIGKAGRYIAQNAVQLHGGIGVSEEHIVSHYFRRLTAIGMLLGDTESQIERLSALGGFTSAEPHFAAA